VRLLVLGGTLFLGRHVVEAALERGHEVTLFNRGRTNRDLFLDAEHLRGDRDGDLSALVGRGWDAVVDPSGYVPRVVRASVELLATAAQHYTFVSSISVYRDFASVGIAEDYPVAELPEESEDVDRYYGPLKALSEDVVRDVFAERALVVRSGLIVGPYDWTNRFGWWVHRIARGGDVLVPDEPEWRVQIVHGRDLAEWILDLAERAAGGTFNATSEPIAMARVLDEAQRTSGSDARFVAVGERFLLERGVEPFEDLPLWLAPTKNPEYRGFFAVDVSSALAGGLGCRPLAETIADTLAWRGESVGKDYGPSALTHGLDPERERELLAAWATLKS
jgi:2'-hydroxyisoflavone reductase